MIIGHHILQGKAVTLEKPIAVIAKNVEEHSFHGDAVDVSMETESSEDDSTHYTVKAIIKRKVLFKTRPKPIIAHVPKKI